MATVLLADDDETLRLMVGRRLHKAGHDVTLASDGLAAASLLERQQFDVVLSDMQMPGLDGLELLERASGLAPDTEFVILTGYGTMENAVEAFRKGNVFDYLQKPLEDIRAVDAAVNRAVERRRLRQENERLVRELAARVRELEEAKSKLQYMAERDGLTGAYNHRAIHSRLDAALRSCKESQVAVMLVDLDGFKRFNDTYGHPVGDQLLRHLAAALRSCCPENALIGRCGGDEFMLVLPDTAAHSARQLAGAIRSYVTDRPFDSPEGVALPVPVCFGVSDTAVSGRSAAALVAAADSALFEGKRAGGNTVRLHIAGEDAAENPEHHTAYTVLDGLITAIDRKDRYTRIHSEYVTAYALKLAEAVGVSEESYNALRVAGLLHDVGKIGVPDAVLRKPGRLSPSEQEVMKSHVIISSLIIHGLPRLQEIRDAVASHHERWDGKGYPKGLAGERIPLLGRILAVADAFAAMTVDRPYRAGMRVEKALAEMEKGSGTQFDPDLCQRFVETVAAQQSLDQAASALAA